MHMYEVVENAKYVGNDIMDLFFNYHNNPAVDVDVEIAKKYRFDQNDHDYATWRAAYNDFENTSYIDETTGEFIKRFNDDDSRTGFDTFRVSEYNHGLYTTRKKPSLRQIKKLYKLGAVKKHYFNNSALFEYVPFVETKLNGGIVYRQGWFFKNKWLNSEFPLIICTSYEDLKRSLDRVIDVKSQDIDMNKRGVEAYQYFLEAFKTLTEQNPDKKYFVKIAFKHIEGDDNNGNYERCTPENGGGNESKGQGKQRCILKHPCSYEGKSKRLSY